MNEGKFLLYPREQSVTWKEGRRKEEGGEERIKEREEGRKTGCELRKCYHSHSFAFTLCLWPAAPSSSLLSVTVDVSSSSLVAW